MAVRDPAFDIVLNDKGYMLARREQLGEGGRAWQVETRGSSIVAQTQTELRYGNQPAIIEAPMVWRTAHLGYGDSQQLAEGRYHYATGLDARVPEQIISGPEITELTVSGGAETVKFVEQGSKLFVISGRYCKEIGSDDVVTSDKDFGDGNYATDAVVFKGNIYVAFGTEAGDAAVWKRDSAGAWTQSGDSVKCEYFTVLNEKLWGSHSDNTIKSVTNDPLASADWSAAYTIGDSGAAITGLCASADVVYIGKEDGLHALDADGAGKMLAPELRGIQDASNGRNVVAWHGSIWLPHLRGLIEYQDLGDNGFRVASAGPAKDADETNPIRGFITALVGDDRWLYAALLTSGGDTYILAGRESQGGGERLIWHPLALMSSEECRAMHIAGLWTSPRLMLGRDNDAAYILLPRYGDNPLQDSLCRYSLTGSIYLPAHSWGAPTTAKIWKSVEIEAENLSAVRYIDVYVRIDGGSWQEVGTANVSPRHTIAFPTSGMAGNKIEVRLDFTTSANTEPITLRSVVLRGAERPSLTDVITAVVRCADNLPRRDSKRCMRTGAEIKTELKNLASSAESVILVDKVGTRRRVLVLPPVEEAEIEEQGGRAPKASPEELLTVRMAVFSVSPTASASISYGEYGTSTYGGGDAYQ